MKDLKSLWSPGDFVKDFYFPDNVFCIIDILEQAEDNFRLNLVTVEDTGDTSDFNYGKGDRARRRLNDPSLYKVCRLTLEEETVWIPT